MTQKAVHWACPRSTEESKWEHTMFPLKLLGFPEGSRQSEGLRQVGPCGIAGEGLQELRLCVKAAAWEVGALCGGNAKPLFPHHTTPHGPRMGPRWHLPCDMGYAGPALCDAGGCTQDVNPKPQTASARDLECGAP